MTGVHRGQGRCAGCGGGRSLAVFPRRSPRHVVCLRCGLVYRDPVPPPGAIEEQYRSSYWERRIEGEGHPRMEARATMAVEWLGAHLSSSSRVLEVGCSTGEVLRALNERFGCDVLGVEPSEVAVELGKAAGHPPIQRRTWDEAEVTPGSLDVVVMLHVLEHFPDPRAALRKARESLGESGRLLVEVPNILRPNPRKRLSSWLAAEHLFYFSPRTLDRELAAAGFEVERTETDTYIRALCRKGAPRAAARSPVEPLRVAAALARHELAYWPARVRESLGARLSRSPMR